MRYYIVPETSYIDEPVYIAISGLQKNQKVVLRAVSEDYYCVNSGMNVFLPVIMDLS